MKSISSILAFLIFIMAIMPCSDGHTCDEEGQEIALDHNHSEDEKDHCSPFCVCSCCGMKINFQDTSNFVSSTTVLNSSYKFSYSSLYSFSFNQSIWHPPAVC